MTGEALRSCGAMKSASSGRGSTLGNAVGLTALPFWARQNKPACGMLLRLGNLTWPSRYRIGYQVAAVRTV